MDRRKALMASTIVTVTLVAGAAAFAANSGLVGSRSDNVGNLQPGAVTTAVTGPPTVVTVFIDPATGAVVTPPAAVASAAPATPGPSGEGGHDDDREEGHGDD